MAVHVEGEAKGVEVVCRKRLSMGPLLAQLSDELLVDSLLPMLNAEALLQFGATAAGECAWL